MGQIKAEKQSAFAALFPGDQTLQLTVSSNETFSKPMT